MVRSRPGRHVRYRCRSEGQYPATDAIVIPASRPGGAGRELAAGETFVDRQPA